MDPVDQIADSVERIGKLAGHDSIHDGVLKAVDCGGVELQPPVVSLKVGWPPMAPAELEDLQACRANGDQVCNVNQQRLEWLKVDQVAGTCVQASV